MDINATSRNLAVMAFSDPAGRSSEEQQRSRSNDSHAAQCMRHRAVRESANGPSPAYAGWPIFEIAPHADNAALIR
jgi:hypothetical protein